MIDPLKRVIGKEGTKKADVSFQGFICFLSFMGFFNMPVRQMCGKWLFSEKSNPPSKSIEGLKQRIFHSCGGRI